MRNALVILLVTAWLGGCVSQVRNGAIIGGLSGAAAGAGVGWAISDKDIAGSGSNPAQGPVALPKGSSIGAGTLIGLAFGAIVGAMIGHRSVPEFEAPVREEPTEPVTDDASDTADAARTAPAHATF